MILFITAKPEHPTKHQIIQTLRKYNVPYEIIHPSISWIALQKKIHHSEQPLCFLAPDHPRIFQLCSRLQKKKYLVINPPEITLLCRHRISIGKILIELLSHYSSQFPDTSIRIPHSRFFKDQSTLASQCVTEDFPLVIKYPVNHSGIHYVDLIRNKSELTKIPDFFKKKGIYTEEFVNANDGMLKCYYFDGTIITQKDSHHSSFQEANHTNPEEYKSRKHRLTIDTPAAVEHYIKYVAKELPISIFGMDFLITDDNKYWLVDFNDFPGSRGIENAGEIIANFLIGKNNHE